MDKENKKKPWKCRLGLHGKTHWERDKPTQVSGQKKGEKIAWIGQERLVCDDCGETISVTILH